MKIRRGPADKYFISRKKSFIFGGKLPQRELIVERFTEL